jgi:hypothetical protein
MQLLSGSRVEDSTEPPTLMASLYNFDSTFKKYMKLNLKVAARHDWRIPDIQYPSIVDTVSSHPDHDLVSKFHILLQEATESIRSNPFAAHVCHALLELLGEATGSPEKIERVIQKYKGINDEVDEGLIDILALSLSEEKYGYFYEVFRLGAKAHLTGLDLVLGRILEMFTLPSIQAIDVEELKSISNFAHIASFIHLDSDVEETSRKVLSELELTSTKLRITENLKSFRQLIRRISLQFPGELLGSNVLDPVFRHNLFRLPLADLNRYELVLEKVLSMQPKASVISFLALNRYIYEPNMGSFEERISKVVSEDHGSIRTLAFIFTDLVESFNDDGFTSSELMVVMDAKEILINIGICLELFGDDPSLERHMDDLLDGISRIKDIGINTVIENYIIPAKQFLQSQLSGE